MARIVDAADWDGVDLVSVNVGAIKNARNRYQGFQYATEAEAMLAELLTRMRIPFTPNVFFSLARNSAGGNSRCFVPDFVFDKRAFLWHGGTGQRELIHGIEAKGAAPGRFPPRALEKVRLLCEQRRIVIKLLTNVEIRAFYRAGALPMYPKPVRKK